MKITHLPSFLWYETNTGKKLYLSQNELKNGYSLPKGAIYQVNRFPTSINTSYLYLKPEGGCEQITCISSTVSEDLVLAMVNQDHFRLAHAMIIASVCCERCMNVLAHNYGLDWGYALHSNQWKESHTSCEYCKDEWFYDIWWNVKLFTRQICYRLHVSK